MILEAGVRVLLADGREATVDQVEAEQRLIAGEPVRQVWVWVVPDGGGMHKVPFEQIEGVLDE